MVPGTDLKLGNSLSSFIRICVLRCLKESQVDVLVLVIVLIKDHLFIKRMLTQKASVYPGFILMSVVTI